MGVSCGACARARRPRDSRRDAAGSVDKQSEEGSVIADVGDPTGGDGSCDSADGSEHKADAEEQSQWSPGVGELSLMDDGEEYRGDSCADGKSGIAHGNRED